MDSNLRRQVYGRGRPWLWHALMDGSRWCNCPHSRMYRGELRLVEHRDLTGRVVAITAEPVRA